MRCKICSREFQSFRELTKHLVKEHDYKAEDLYKYYEYSFETKEATCPICGKKFIMSWRQLKKYKDGTGRGITCGRACASVFMNLVYGNPSCRPEVKEKKRQRALEKYGVENVFQAEEIKKKSRKTNLKKRGVKYPMQSAEVREKSKETNIEKYGVEHVSQREDIKERKVKKSLEKYGVENISQAEEVKNKKKQAALEKYGVEYTLQAPEVKDKSRETNLEKYGVEYFCQHIKCNINGCRISKINKRFKKLLDKNNIENELEYIIGHNGFDLRVGDTLVEIDPYVTHNSTVGPSYGGKEREPQDKDYQLNKTLLAKEKGFKCIHVFDWDDWNKIVGMLQPKESIEVSKCTIEHTKDQTKSCLILYYKGDPVQRMVFKRIVDDNYQLFITYINHKYGVFDGIKALLDCFEIEVKPKSIMVHCDFSKEDGSLYENLGFNLKEQLPPFKHWYNHKTKDHKLQFQINESREKMIDEGYVEIYDCGQLVFTKSY